MGVYSLLTPRLFWDTSFARVVDVGYALDNLKAGPTPREGSSWVTSPAGAKDAWVVGTDYVLEGDLKWIPGRDAIGPKRTGWDGLNNDDGVAAFLTWARNMNTIRYHPNGRNLLVSPLLSTDSNADGVANDWFSNITAGATGSFSIDGANAAQVVTATNSGAAAQAVQVQQVVPCVMPGEVLTASVDAKVDAPVTNGTCAIRLTPIDALGVDITTFDSANITATAFGRVGVTATMPANTASCRIQLRLRASAAGLAGVARFRQAQIRRENTDIATFFDNPFWSVTLVDPMEGTPDPERDGSRILRLKLHSASFAFTDY